MIKTWSKLDQNTGHGFRMQSLCPWINSQAVIWILGYFRKKGFFMAEWGFMMCFTVDNDTVTRFNKHLHFVLWFIPTFCTKTSSFVLGHRTLLSSVMPENSYGFHLYTIAIIDNEAHSYGKSPQLWARHVELHNCSSKSLILFILIFFWHHTMKQHVWGKIQKYNIIRCL